MGILDLSLYRSWRPNKILLMFDNRYPVKSNTYYLFVPIYIKNEKFLYGLKNNML